MWWSLPFSILSARVFLYKSLALLHCLASLHSYRLLGCKHWQGYPVTIFEMFQAGHST